MYSSNRYDSFSPIIISLIREKSQELIKHEAFFTSDLEDIEQELMINLLEKLDKVDVKYSLFSFAKRIIDNKAKQLLRHKLTKKRYVTAKSSSAEYSGDKYQFNIDDVIDICYEEKIKNLEQKIDLSKLASELPADLANLLSALQKKSISELSRDSNISRKKLYKDLNKLKKHFQNIDSYH